MKLGTWWVVFDDKGRARVTSRESKKDAWGDAYYECAAISATSFRYWQEGVIARGWTCEKVEIWRPE